MDTEYDVRSATSHVEPRLSAGFNDAHTAHGSSRRHLLEQIESPAALRALELHELPLLCDELRDFLIDSVADTGGHFASNLGACELTVALHWAFDTPNDRIVFDVGHQSYPHKILTGRRDRMTSIRKPGGLSGFPSRAESPYDAFGTAHSSTSISAALGMAAAFSKAGRPESESQNESRHAIAVIGDGALTAGLAYEALCNVASVGGNLLIVINDNQMSISESVGAVPFHLQQLALRRQPVSTPSQFCATGYPTSLFETLGLPYEGIADGHDVIELALAFERLRCQPGVKVLHIRTRKGQGYAPAERDAIAYHGPGPFDRAKGIARKPAAAKPAAPTYSQVFGRWLCAAARRDRRVIGITPAMREGSDLIDFARDFPDRYYDVGIAEQHALTFAAGLACESVRPVVAIYSTFLQRAYDQLIHDIALQNLPVMLALDRAGLVGADGATHAGSFDIASLRCVPNMTLMAAADEQDLWRMLQTGLSLNGPSAVRYPRGKGPGVPINESAQALVVGQAQRRRKGQRIALMAFGSMLQPALEAAEELDATVVNMRFIKPLDERMICKLADSHDILVSVEEGAQSGGVGSAVQEVLTRLRFGRVVLPLGLPDEFLDHGNVPDMLGNVGLDADGICEAIRRIDCKH
ncbi:MAG: 1-deoxy-D-xylulose-5-phosphate synthase [Burkholderiaceae bacterium]